MERVSHSRERKGAKGGGRNEKISRKPKTRDRSWLWRSFIASTLFPIGEFVRGYRRTGRTSGSEVGRNIGSGIAHEGLGAGTSRAKDDETEGWRDGRDPYGE